MCRFVNSSFFSFNSPSPRPPGADGSHRGRGHVGRHYPYTNNIWCGCVQALLRYRSKTAKMQKFPVDSYSNENFICPFFRPPGAANPQKGKRHIRNQSTPAFRWRWRTNKHTVKHKYLAIRSTSEWRVTSASMAGNKCVSRTDTNPPFAFQTASPRGTDFTGFLQGAPKSYIRCLCRMALRYFCAQLSKIVILN